MNILGISAFYHDSAAALINDGQIISAIQEERLTRKKHDDAFPAEAIKHCLLQGNLSINDLDAIVFYEKPFLKFERLLETYLTNAPRGFSSFRKALPVWIREKLFQKDLLIKELKKLGADKSIESKIRFSEHHLSHAASAFFPSPYDKALVLTMDGVGEWATATVAVGNGNKLDILKEIHFPHSLGLLYSAFTYYCGFKVNSGEYKLMGLAPYGQPIYTDLIKNNLIDIKEDGSFRLDMRYFDYATGLKMITKKFEALFGKPAKQAGSENDPFYMDIAASIQAVTEEIMLKITRALVKETGITNLCLSGGVALNCVANGKIVRDGIIKNLWIQPASGDAGGALGAAFAYHYLANGATRNTLTKSAKDHMQGSYLGLEFNDDDIEKRLKKLGAIFEKVDEKTLLTKTVDALTTEKVIGWFQGRMEYGPRALVGRSILADPRSPAMQKNLNLKIKFRESFRPFAPIILAEDVQTWFEHDGDSPYMLVVADVQKNKRRKLTEEEEKRTGLEKLNTPRSDIPAVTHVDFSARLQTIHKETNPLAHKLVSAFKKETDCPVLVNTSFNVRGEPIVCTPEDAFKCFMGTNMDVLAIGSFILKKEDQDPSLAEDYKDKFDLD